MRLPAYHHCYQENWRRLPQTLHHLAVVYDDGDDDDDHDEHGCYYWNVRRMREVHAGPGELLYHEHLKKTTNLNTLCHT